MQNNITDERKGVVGGNVVAPTMTLNFSINSKNKLKNNNTYKYDFVDGGIKINENDSLTITQAIIPNSICNFTSYYNNLDFAYIDNNNITNKVSLKSGFYTIDDLNKAMQEVMFNNGHYYSITKHNDTYSIQYPLTLTYNKPQYSFFLQKFVASINIEEQSYYLTNETFSNDYLYPSSYSLLVYGPSRNNYTSISDWKVSTGPAVNQGSILITPTFVKSTDTTVNPLLITNINIGANYNKEITISTPISSYNAVEIAYENDNNDYNNTITLIHNITSISCNVYNSLYQLIASPTVSSNVGFNITKTVGLKVDYDEYFEYEQYFLNASITFRPTFKTIDEGYRIEMSINELVGTITNTPTFDKSDGLITSIDVSANYNKDITINIPISSYNEISDYNEGYTYTILNRIMNITCNIYNSLDELVLSPVVFSSDYAYSTIFDIVKTVTYTVNYDEYYFYFEQYFFNTIIKFRPPLKNTNETYRIEMLFNNIPSGIITNTPNFNKTSSFIVTSIAVDAYYRKTITINIPISSYNTGLNQSDTLNFTHTINIINIIVYNHLEEIVAIEQFNGVNINKFVTVYGDIITPDYTYEQFFRNASITFTPLYQKVSETYRVELAIIGTGQWRINTNVSTHVRNNSSIIFNNPDGTGYVASNYTETIYGGSGDFRFNTDISTEVKNDNEITFNNAYGTGYVASNYTEENYSGGQWSVNSNVSTHNSVSFVTFNDPDGIGYSSANYNEVVYSVDGSIRYGNRIFYSNTSFGIIQPLATISPLNHFLLFYGYEDNTDYNSLFIDYFYLPEGNYTIDIWMAKRLLGTDYINIVSILNGIIYDTTTITLINTVNEWNKYSFDIVSIGVPFKFVINIYGNNNNFIGIASVKIFKKYELFIVTPDLQSSLIINEKFELNVLPPNTTNIIVTGNSETYSITGWYIRSFDTGSTQKVYFSNKTITGLIPPPIDIFPTRQFLAFYGTGNRDNNGNYPDYYSITQRNAVYIPAGDYILEIWMVKLTRGLPLDFIVFGVPSGEYRIDLYDIANVWNKYSFTFSSTGQNYAITATIYATKINQLIGISSFMIFKNPVLPTLIVNEKFQDNVLPPNTINVLVTGYNNFNYSVNGWVARSYSGGGVGDRIYFSNTAITFLGSNYLTPPTNVSPSNQFLSFYGTGDTENGNINDFNSISQEVNILYGDYTFEISMAKRITGSVDYVKCAFQGTNYSEVIQININDVPNVWTKYSLSIPRITVSTTLNITIFVYPAQYNQLIGISSFSIMPNKIVNNYKLFPNAYTNNEYSLETYLIGRNTGNSYSTLPSGIPKYGLSMNPINGFTIRCNLIKNNISNTKDFLETIPLINSFGSNNVFRGNDNSLTKIQKGKYRSIQFFLCDQKGNMIILLDPNLFINFCIGVGVGKPTVSPTTPSLLAKPKVKPIVKPVVKQVVKPLAVVKPSLIKEKSLAKPIVKTSKPLKITL